MTSIPSTQYPTEWHVIDAVDEIECRQLDEEHYELSSPVSSVITDAIGFDIFRSGDTVAWNNWLKANRTEVRKKFK